MHRLAATIMFSVFSLFLAIPPVAAGGRCTTISEDIRWWKIMLSRHSATRDFELSARRQHFDDVITNYEKTAQNREEWLKEQGGWHSQFSKRMKSDKTLINLRKDIEKKILERDKEIAVEPYSSKPARDLGGRL